MAENEKGFGDRVKNPNENDTDLFSKQVSSTSVLATSMIGISKSLEQESGKKVKSIQVEFSDGTTRRFDPPEYRQVEFS